MKSAEDTLIRPCANGFIVYPDHNINRHSVAREHVFTTPASLAKWIEKSLITKDRKELEEKENGQCNKCK